MRVCLRSFTAVDLITPHPDGGDRGARGGGPDPGGVRRGHGGDRRARGPHRVTGAGHRATYARGSLGPIGKAFWAMLTAVQRGKREFEGWSVPCAGGA
jgi:hypothetical protein